MRTWVEIDMDNLAYNMEILQNKVHKTQVMAVVKANGYGMGAVEIARYLSKKCGIGNFAVATLDEAIELREAGIYEEILVLGALLPNEIIEANEYNIQITIGNWEQIRFIEENRLGVSMHIKVDTGMGRLGFVGSDAHRAINYSLDRGLKVVGIYSHLSDADGFNKISDKYTLKQIEKFKEFDIYRDRIKYLHLLNSAGILRFGSYFEGTMARSGLCMYGMIGNNGVSELKNIFNLKTRILSIRTVDEDSYISYGRKYVLCKGETFATLGIGYADGLKKQFATNGYVIIEGEKCQIIGEICMDMCMVKIPESIKHKIKLGTEVIVLNRDIIEEVTFERKCSWEIMVGIGRRVYRVYREKGVPYLKTK